MHKESEQGEANAGQAQSAEKDGKPIQLMDLVRRLFRCMRAIPWVTFGAISTGCGVALLYFYFRSIDFVPADIPSILSASLFVAMLAFAFYMWVVLSLIAPLWGYVETGLHGQVLEKSAGSQFSLSGLWALQFMGVGGFLIFLGYLLWRDCKPEAPYFLILGGALVLMGLVGWVVHEVKSAGEGAVWWMRLHHVAWVCLLSALPFFTLWLYLIPNRGTEWLHLGVFFVTWLLVVAGSSIFLHKIPVWASALIAVCAMPLLTISIPVLQGNPSLLPTLVAELAGIRSKKTDELRVPKSTCDLIQNALGSAQAVNPLTCGEGEWGTVHAQVLSNLGDRWFIELSLAGAAAQGSNGVLRLSIPGDGVQKVRRIAAPPASCRS
jgi:hypothetical protein